MSNQDSNSFVSWLSKVLCWLRTSVMQITLPVENYFSNVWNFSLGC
jgi:hypothetical protein